MSKSKQTSKNIELTGKLLEFLANSKNLPKLPQNVAFVPFSNTDKELNKANEDLLESLSQEDKPVIKAEEPKTSQETWNLIPVNF